MQHKTLLKLIHDQLKVWKSFNDNINYINHIRICENLDCKKCPIQNTCDSQPHHMNHKNINDMLLKYYKVNKWKSL